MHFNVVTLARCQFALTIMFHYLFPPLSIGISAVMVFLEAQYLRTRDRVFLVAAKFWTELFAINFGMGVATGLVMEFEFGMNWAVYSRFVGDVFGSALAAEGVFAFFLESGFLAFVVYGWNRVSPKFHFFSTVMVSLGSIFSAVWIIVANSWQQTPAGDHIVQMMRNGKPWFDAAGHPVMRAEIVDFWAVVFNPSSMDRLIHTILAALLLGAAFVMSVSAYYLLRRRHKEFARRSFAGALTLATIFSLAQLWSGHSNARMVAHYQPAKLAAFEGHFETGVGNLSLVGWPDEEAKKLRFQISIPGMLSFLATGDPRKPVLGLDRVPREYWPPVLIVFLTYHAMVGIGMFFIGLTLFGSFLHWRRSLFRHRWLLRVFMGSVLLAVAGNEFGWMSAEVGRQPWVVHPPVIRDAAGDPQLTASGYLQYHLSEGLRTNKAVSEAVAQDQVATSIFLFGLVYAVLLSVYLLVMNSKIQKGPETVVLPEATSASTMVEVASGRIDHTETLTT